MFVIIVFQIGIKKNLPEFFLADFSPNDITNFNENVYRKIKIKIEKFYHS